MPVRCGFCCGLLRSSFSHATYSFCDVCYVGRTLLITVKMICNYLLIGKRRKNNESVAFLRIFQAAEILARLLLLFYFVFVIVIPNPEMFVFASYRICSHFFISNIRLIDFSRLLKLSVKTACYVR